MIGNGAVIVPDNLYTTGTASSSTYLRGDGSWSPVVQFNQSLNTNDSVTFANLTITNTLSINTNTSFTLANLTVTNVLSINTLTLNDLTLNSTNIHLGNGSRSYEAAIAIGVNTYAFNNGIAIGTELESGGPNNGNGINIGLANDPAGNNSIYIGNSIQNPFGVFGTSTAVVLSACSDTQQSIYVRHNGFYVTPVGASTTTNILYYNPTTKEISYGPNFGGAGGGTGLNPFDQNLYTTSSVTFASVTPGFIQLATNASNYVNTSSGVILLRDGGAGNKRGMEFYASYFNFYGGLYTDYANIQYAEILTATNVSIIAGVIGQPTGTLFKDGNGVDILQLKNGNTSTFYTDLKVNGNLILNKLNISSATITTAVIDNIQDGQGNKIIEFNGGTSSDFTRLNSSLVVYGTPTSPEQGSITADTIATNFITSTGERQLRLNSSYNWHNRGLPYVEVYGGLIPVGDAIGRAPLGTLQNPWSGLYVNRYSIHFVNTETNTEEVLSLDTSTLYINSIPVVDQPLTTSSNVLFGGLTVNNYALPQFDGTATSAIVTNGAGALSFQPAVLSANVFLDGGSAASTYTITDFSLDGGNAYSTY
jgi:hypothetical protein